MAFTYNGTLTTSLDCVRFYIQDTVSAAGPKPSDANFTDAELGGLITLEGSWERAVAAAFEALAAAWAKHVTFSADGVSVSQSNIAQSYQAEAAKWRKLYGSGSAGTTGVVEVTRIDGYSDDVSSAETEEEV